MKKSLYLLVCVGFSLGVDEEGGFCEAGYINFQSSCFKILNEVTGLSWIEAILECQKNRAILAEPSSEQVSEFLRELTLLHHELLQQDEWFIGLSDMYVERKWIMPSTGLVPNFTMWQVGSPAQDYLNVQDCAVMIVNNGDVKWKDVSCTDHRGNYSYPILPVCQKPRCPLDSQSFDDNCYFSVKTEMTWEDAEAYCVAQGGHLASIHTQEENDFILSLIKSAGRNVWIGAMMTGSSEDAFEWTDGSPMDYNNWYYGQPNDGIGSAIEMFPSDGTWVDLPVSYNRLSLCKI